MFNKNLDKNEDKNSAEGVTSVGTNDVNDPYAYIKDKGFTTEIFKIEIQNLPRRFGIKVCMCCINVKT